MLPTSTTDTEIEEPGSSQEVLGEDKLEAVAETKSVMKQVSEIQIVCDRDEKEVSIPSSPFKAPSPSLKDPSPLPSPNKSSPHTCEASLIESRTGEAKEAVEEELLVELEEPEVGVEAEDLFRDIALRTEALSAPTSFKFSQRQRYYK